jgi:hypothetical protein
MTRASWKDRRVLYSSKCCFNSLDDRVIDKLYMLDHVKLVQLRVLVPDLSLWNDVNGSTTGN